MAGCEADPVVSPSQTPIPCMMLAAVLMALGFSTA
jgi:hypothetical protein